MKTTDTFKDYEIIATSSGEKLERWKNIYLLRPDPQIIWENPLDESLADAHYYRSNTGGGHWQINKKIPDSWLVSYQDLKFNVKLMNFKHTGIFPEQAYNWDYMMTRIKEETENGKKPKVLNLFAYTGCASVCLLKAGAEVVHVDSSKGMIEWAKENVKSNNLTDAPIRYIVDDVVKFVKREIRRGNKYDAIIMDPPSYGKGANKEIWNIEKDLFNLVNLCMQILTKDPLFFIINSYSANLSQTIIENILKITFKSYNGKITSDEIGLKTKEGLILPCGVYARYER